MLRCQVVPVTAFRQNCSVIWCEKTREAAIIDPGGDLHLVMAAISRHGVTPGKILVTHGHADHAGGVADLAERLGLPVEGPEREDQFWLGQLSVAGLIPGLGPSRTFVPDRWLRDGDRVTLGEVLLEVIHCPGHTPGHVVFFSREDRLAFVGDVLFQGSVGRTDFPRGDSDALIRSIRGKLFPLGDDVVFVPGHGPCSTFGAERLDNPFVSDRICGRA